VERDVTDTSPAPSLVTGREALRRLCGGAVYLPGDDGYEAARTPWNLGMQARPAAVAYPAFADEVAGVLRAAAALGLRVLPQGTGHGAMSVHGGLDDAVLLRTAAMTELQVDVERRTARVGAGVRWGDVVRAAGAAGLAARHMSSPDVGVVGSSLGGGLSWYARRHGLQCSALTAVDVVLADGTAVHATDAVDAELLWAARGGGGGFGVVTAVEFDLLPVAAAYAGMLVWDWDRAGDVLCAWARWTAEVPESVTTVVRVVQTPDDPQLPVEVRGRRLVVLDGALLEGPDAAAEMLRPLRALRPETDTFALMPAPALADLHLEGSTPAAASASSLLLDGLPEAAVDAVVRTVGPSSGSTLATLEIRQLGGALARPAPRPGALDHLDGAFLLLGLGIDVDLERWEGQRDDARRALDALAPWALPQRYLPMAEDEVDASRGWAPQAWDRLRAVRAAADPRGLFVLPLQQQR
jgi:FAD/FMN-containing dehydrogenase